jgi:hypothetical protein
MSQYQALHAHFEKINDLRHLQAICGWDEAAMMPAGGGAARAGAMSTLGLVIHDLLTDPVPSLQPPRYPQTLSGVWGLRPHAVSKPGEFTAPIMTGKPCVHCSKT